MSKATKGPQNPAPVESHEEIAIPAMDLREATLHIVGTSPLIVHAWSEKAKKQMRDKQQKNARQAKAAKDPDEDFRGSLYYISHEPPIYGMPIISFKAAASDAWAHVESMKKTVIRGAFHVINGIPTDQGDLVELRYESLRMREDMVRVGMGTADIRYRGEFTGWSVDLDVRFNARVISLSQLTNLLDVAGFACGVGEWRPQKDGSFGMFRVDGVQ